MAGYAAVGTSPRKNEPPVVAVGKARGGSADHGGPIWLDFDEAFEDSREVPRIVGHTRCPEQTQKSESCCIDFMQAAYAVVEAGEVQLRIWPKSWLREVMLGE